MQMIITDAFNPFGVLTSSILHYYLDEIRSISQARWLMIDIALYTALILHVVHLQCI